MRTIVVFSLAALLIGCGSRSTDSDAGDATIPDTRGSDVLGGDTLDVQLPTDAAIIDASDASAVDGGTSFACTPLPPPTGMVIHVTTAQANDLPSIVSSAPAGATVMLADGTYRMTTSGEAARRINITHDGVTLRAASDNADAVIIDAEYQTDEIIDVLASNVTIAHITIEHAVNHAIHLTPYSPTDLTNAVINGVHFIDEGEQFIKINGNDAHTAYVDNSRVECSDFRMTDAGRMHVASNSGGSCYTGGIDNHGGRAWVVRRNAFDGIYCTNGGLAEHAVHFWHGSRDVLIEDNVITDCARGVGLGLVQTDDPANPARVYGDHPYASVGFMGDIDGLVRNNVIYANVPYFDTGIELDQAHGARVFQNTVIHGSGATNFFSSVDYRFDHTLATIQNNLTDRITVRDGAAGTVDHNLEMTPASDFVNETARDFHLAAGASDAIDRGTVLTESGLDLDGHSHSSGAAPDLGAYER